VVAAMAVRRGGQGRDDLPPVPALPVGTSGRPERLCPVFSPRPGLLRIDAVAAAAVAVAAVAVAAAVAIPRWWVPGSAKGTEHLHFGRLVLFYVAAKRCV